MLIEENKEQFRKAYEEAYSYEETDTYSLQQEYLTFVYIYVAEACNEINTAKASPDTRIQFAEYIVASPRYPTYKFLWLFEYSNLRFDLKKFMQFVISKNDYTLQTVDYILSFYLSQQDEKTFIHLQKVMPLNMLYDIFTPVAEAEFKKWCA
jgi:hypothetical protein